MGCWNGTDMITYLPIMGGEPIRVLVLKQQASAPDCGGVCYADDMWEPIGPAIKGVYNNYGRPEKIVDDFAAQWLNHILPMDNEIRKNIEGHCFDTELDEKILAVERGVSMLRGKNLCHWIVREETWQYLQSMKVEYFGAPLEERLKALLEIGPTEDPNDHIGWMKHDTAIHNLFGYLPAPTDVIRFTNKDNFEEAVMSLVELKHVTDVMNMVRRYFMPVSGAGSQTTELKMHKQLAQFTVKSANKSLKEGF